jgi:hypothetical protein
VLGPCPPRYGGIPDHLQAVSERFLVPQIVDRAKREHPYEVPSVVAVPSSTVAPITSAGSWNRPNSLPEAGRRAALVAGALFSHRAQGGGIWPDGAGMPRRPSSPGFQGRADRPARHLRAEGLLVLPELELAGLAKRSADTSNGCGSTSKVVPRYAQVAVHSGRQRSAAVSHRRP